MSETELKEIIKKYRYRSVMILMAALLFAVGANWFLINSAIERHHELGLIYTSPDSGFIWGAVILGLNTVLLLSFHFFEKILIQILKQQNAKPV
tara:strand:- start:162 stop:443 length:282 start_codon:yes stop_codon:yes gene_type:complete